MNKKQLTSFIKWTNLISGAIATGLFLILGRLFLQSDAPLPAFIAIHAAWISLLVTFLLLTVTGFLLYCLLRRLPE